MGTKFGYECRLFRNTATYETPTWVEVDNVKDLTLPLAEDEADTSTRKDRGFKTAAGSLLDAPIEFQMVWDPEDEGFTAIQQAFFARTGIEMAVLDGEIDVAGSQGLRATMAVLNFTRNENLGEAVTVSVTMKPKRADNPPEWMTVPDES